MSNYYRQIVEKLDELVKSRFIEMFGQIKADTELNDLCTFISRGKSAKYVEDSNVFIIGQACIRTDKIEFDRVRCSITTTNTSEFRLKFGDVLVNSTGVGSLGRCYEFINPDERLYVTDSHVTILRLNLSSLRPTFIRCYLNQDNVQNEIYKKCVNGSTNQIELNKNSFLHFKVPRAPIDKQIEFENFVKQVDKSKVIALKAAEKYDQLVKSRFIEMFGDLQTQPIALNKVCTFINGDRGVNYPSKEDFVESGIPFVNAGHLINGVIDFSEMNYITQDKYDKLGSGKIERGDILYCLRGSIGKQAISTITHAAIASSLVILRPSKDILPEYLSYELGSVRAQKYLAQCKNGSSQPNLSADSLKKYSLRIPPLEQQQSFVEFVKQADKSKVTTEQECKQ